METAIHNVFVSYSASARKLADELTRRLASAGLTVLSHDEIEAGESYRVAILELIKASDIVVLLLDDQFERSNYTAIEVSAALSFKKKIIPVRLTKEARVPGILSSTLWLDTSSSPENAAALIHLHVLETAKRHDLDTGPAAEIVRDSKSGKEGITTDEVISSLSAELEHLQQYEHRTLASLLQRRKYVYFTFLATLAASAIIAVIITRYGAREVMGHPSSINTDTRSSLPPFNILLSLIAGLVGFLLGIAFPRGKSKW